MIATEEPIVASEIIHSWITIHLLQTSTSSLTQTAQLHNNSLNNQSLHCSKNQNQCQCKRGNKWVILSDHQRKSHHKWTKYNWMHHHQQKEGSKIKTVIHHFLKIWILISLRLSINLLLFLRREDLINMELHNMMIWVERYLCSSYLVSFSLLKAVSNSVTSMDLVLWAAWR